MTAPKKPDLQFFRRYAGTFTYGFWLEFKDTRPETVTQSENWLTLRLNPQEYEVETPAATAINMTQGGGKVIESRGALIKNISLSGVSGYLPASSNFINRSIPPSYIGNKNTNQSNRLFAETDEAEDDRAYRSGFAGIHILEWLFEKFFYHRKNGEFVRMHFFNEKDEHFFQVEPLSIRVSKTLRSPMSYRYSISLKWIRDSLDRVTENRVNQTLGSTSQASTIFGIDSDVSSLGVGQTLISSTNAQISTGQSPLETFELPFVKSKTTSPTLSKLRNRLSDLFNNGVLFVSRLAGKVQLDFQAVLTEIGGILQFFNNIADTADYVLDSILNILKQYNTQINALFDTIDRFASNTIKEELNEYLVEAKTLWFITTNHIIKTFGNSSQDNFRKLDEIFSKPRGLTGSSSDLLKETGKPLTVSPVLGQSRLAMMADPKQNVGTRPEPIYDKDTIFTIARRTLGTPSRFAELITINNLEAPYIVANKNKKPSNTLAYGEYIQVPDSSLKIVSPSIDQSSNFTSFANTVSETGTDTEVKDRIKETPWRENQWVGYTVIITSGAVFDSGDNVRLIIQNDEDVLTVHRPWTVIPSVDDSYEISLQEFYPNEQNLEERRVFGKDIMLVFTFNGQTVQADIRKNHKGDINQIFGRQNFIQSLLKRGYTDIGSHPILKDYGLLLPVGDRMLPDTLLFYQFQAKQSLLRDPRVESVSSLKISGESGLIRLQANIQPRATRVSIPLQVNR